MTDTITSDDRRISYDPLCDRLTIDGRDTWRGAYVGADGVATQERVEDGIWEAACTLRRAVDQRIEAQAEAARQRDYDRQDARADLAAEIAAATRGTAYDPTAF
jgi:phage/plasmid primase-like uncharacterized protein